jgi:hypothetical protein
MEQVKSKRRLDDSERQRLDELNAEHTKKLESRGYNEELTEGIYYYKLTLEGTETLTGYIMLKR